ncbi:MAG TPA: hypothetical protein VNR17_10205 [Luteimicrobium sp.]|nr:hypothetical protein [Luteimicrobium sp.]
MLAAAGYELHVGAADIGELRDAMVSGRCPQAHSWLPGDRAAEERPRELADEMLAGLEDWREFRFRARTQATVIDDELVLSTRSVLHYYPVHPSRIMATGPHHLEDLSSGETSEWAVPTEEVSAPKVVTRKAFLKEWSDV